MKVRVSLIQQVFLSALCVFLASRAFATTDNGTLTVGQQTWIGGCPLDNTDNISVGYVQGGVGSYSSSLLTGNRVVNYLFDDGWCAGGIMYQSYLGVGNFASSQVSLGSRQ